MIRKIFNFDLFTNPPSPHDLLIGVDQFSCRGTVVPYSQVKCLRYWASQTDHYFNFRYSGKSYDTEFDIYMNDNLHPIKIRHGGSTLKQLSAGEQDQDAVRSAYLEISEKTFSYRLKSYIDSLTQYGCFEYDGKRFFPDGKVTEGSDTHDIPSQIKEGKFRREPFKVYIELPKSIAGKILHRLAQQDMGVPLLKERNFVISTEYDADVFFTLLKRLYSLQFND